jgi:predicted porin
MNPVVPKTLPSPTIEYPSHCAGRAGWREFSTARTGACAMKKVLSLMVGAAFAQAASAQGNVTIFGSLDMGVRAIKNSGSSAFTSVGDQGNLANRLGFKGEEDLGDGLKATFHLETGILPDTGESIGQSFGIGFWNRQATVGLKGSWGEIRLGRDWTASYASMWVYDPSYGFGVTDTTHVSHNTGQPTYFWTNNAISYFLPGGLGGFYGQVMVAPGEGSTNGKYAGARVGYTSGPFDVSVGAGAQDVVGGKFKVFNVGASYDFGVAKVSGLYNQEKVIDAKETRLVVGVTVPMGTNYAFASFARSSVADYPGFSGATQIGVGYVHALSKRTAVYGSVAVLDNRATGQLSTTNIGSFGATPPTPGGQSRGAELGLRLMF